jgi:NADH-quinone oxidoreductase subunit L
MPRYIGLPEFAGGSILDHWLEPVIHGHGGEHGHHSLGLELGLMGTSILAAGIGVLIASVLYYFRTPRPHRMGDSAAFLSRILYNKYYVDEVYQFVFVGGVLLLSRIGAAFDRYVIDTIVDGTAKITILVSAFNGLVDKYIVDMLVNAVANITFAVGNNFRRLQTGNINTYLYVVIGAVVLLLFFKLSYWS